MNLILPVCIISFLFYPKFTLSYDYCIFFKNGSKILVDDHWDEGSDLCYEVNEKKYIINQNQVLKIIDTERYSYLPQNGSTNKKDYNLSIFESDGGKLSLNDGSVLMIEKSWIANNKLAVLLNNNVVLFNINDIRSLQKRKNFTEKNHVDLNNIKIESISESREKAFHKNRTTKSLLRKLRYTKKLCDEIKNQLRLEYDAFTENSNDERFSNLIIKSSACQKELSETHYELSKWADKFYAEYNKKHKKNDLQ